MCYWSFPLMFFSCSTGVLHLSYTAVLLLLHTDFLYWDSTDVLYCFPLLLFSTEILLMFSTEVLHWLSTETVLKFTTDILLMFYWCSTDVLLLFYWCSPHVWLMFPWRGRFSRSSEVLLADQSRHLASEVLGTAPWGPETNWLCVRVQRRCVSLKDCTAGWRTLERHNYPDTHE